ncbi:kynurenine formamidase isoform X4 [Narcine bancroftii]|uniref:kynurenine formamidase isoform X4 n=1 Tax=Narcine bancroftii TaxID=1343680 RepID=UPI0038313623
MDILKDKNRGKVNEELEKQYSPSCWSHRMDRSEVIESHIKEMTKGTIKGRNEAHTNLDEAYGQEDYEKLDIYLPPNSSTAPTLLIYFHGGYWQMLSKDMSGFMVPPLIEAGVTVVVVDYVLAPKGNMDTIVSQVRRSVAYIVQQYSAVRSDAMRNSPLELVNNMKGLDRNSEIVVAVAQYDSTEFRKQSQEYYQAIKVAGFNASFQDVTNRDHFDVIEKLVEENYILTQVLLKMVTRK